MSKMKILKNWRKHFFPIVLNNIFSENYVTESKTVACNVLTDKQTNKQKSKDREKPFQGFWSYLPSAHYQGAV